MSFGRSGGRTVTSGLQGSPHWPRAAMLQSDATEQQRGILHFPMRFGLRDGVGITWQTLAAIVAREAQSPQRIVGWVADANWHRPAWTWAFGARGGNDAY